MVHVVYRPIMPLKPSDGLRVNSRRPGEPDEMTWPDFLRAVTEADETARKKARKGKRKRQERRAAEPQPHTLIAEQHKRRPIERTCAFVHGYGDRKGKRCGNWAMKGATRCHFHGGYRQNPKHPATLRRYRNGDIAEVTAQKRAAQECNQWNKADRDRVWGWMRQHRVSRELGPVAALEGLKALTAQDNGRAWRRWRAHIERQSNRARMAGKGEQEQGDSFEGWGMVDK